MVFDTCLFLDDESGQLVHIVVKGVLFISQEQMDDLLDRMGIETFDYYVDKLSDSSSRKRHVSKTTMRPS